MEVLGLAGDLCEDHKKPRARDRDDDDYRHAAPPCGEGALRRARHGAYWMW
jgi:hypothetical protein